MASPASNPVTLAEVESHLRLDSSNYVQAPTAPTVALASPAAPGNADNGAHRYRVTFVTADGETDGGDVSSAVTVADNTVNGQVAVSAIPVGPSGVTSRKLYRTAAGGSTYLLLATIADNTTTTYTDNTADASLGAGVPGTNSTADPLVTALISAAVDWAEGKLNRALMTQTWQLTLDEFPLYPTTQAPVYPFRPYLPGYYNNYSSGLTRAGWYAIQVPRPNLLTVTSIQYVDTNGATQTLDSAAYVVDTASLPGKITPTYGDSWPVTRCQPNAVTVTYTAGYGSAADVPQGIKQAILLVIGDLYRNREARAVGPGITITENPAVNALLAPYVYREAP